VLVVGGGGAGVAAVVVSGGAGAGVEEAVVLGVVVGVVVVLDSCVVSVVTCVTAGGAWDFVGSVLGEASSAGVSALAVGPVVVVEAGGAMTDAPGAAATSGLLVGRGLLAAAA
jgi:hypothetical protein